ncbi:hypothetical protein EJ05DRAFT_439436 [Pseudovirgaria hyperparasitica]|uniref:Ubiquitination network signaling protein n=1 Tax=Pseudovirgaria hyperparasitica TaxID=470096 RepID=A0A6A6W7X3_9PEZI|nr:uncharacterized protein EJ05DRAFT_439436 [Pseudovirgaria hyperparasitica]KAF2758124.1 hypothetical protein EJ05DRAFT_439436 [Pseudovirgaria hyperparasitica]
MPQKSSRRNAANQHDKRHESGLAAPGKRIPKQRSSQNLNGQTNGKPKSSSPPLPAADVDQNTPLPATPNGSTHGIDVDMAGKVNTKPVTGGRDRIPSDASLDIPDFEHANANGSVVASTDSPRQPNGYTTASGSKRNAFSLATTILSSCPLQDVIAILIILLQLGPTALTILHFLFTALTFVPPPTASSTSAFPSMTDIFQGAGGTPSIGLIIFVDGVILCAWLALWVPVQNFVLDLAQAVIAISLGGAAAGKGGMTNSIVISILIVGASNLNRCGFLRHHLVDATSVLLSKAGYSLVEPTNDSIPRSFSCSTPSGWVRSLLGVHIISQGVLRVIRRSLAHPPLPPIPNSRKTPQDPEVAASAQARKNSVSADGSPDVTTTSSTDGRPPGQPPAHREAKEKAISTKRKKRQAAYVRSQQPFWAAIASTKVTVIKEVEQSKAANDADEASATDPNHIGNAKFHGEEDRIWISTVASAEVLFGANLYQTGEDRERELEESAFQTGKSTKPIYVRVNGTVWRSTDIDKIRTRNTDTGSYTEWKGEIYGLTAFSNYLIEFVKATDDAVLCTTSIITARDPSAELAPTASPAAPKLRPSSPATTLKESITTNEQTLSELRNRSKRTKREHQKQITALRSDLDRHKNRIAGAGGNDDRQQSRLLQMKLEVAQTEDDIANLEAQLATSGDIPEEEHDEYYARKKAWRVEMDRKASVEEELKRCKSEHDRQVSSIEQDITSALQKRERLAARKAKLDEQRDKLLAAAANEQERKNRRAAELSGRAMEEQSWLDYIESFEQNTAIARAGIAELEKHNQHMEAVFQAAQQQRPSSPDAHLAMISQPTRQHNMSMGPMHFSHSLNGNGNANGNGNGFVYYQPPRGGRSSSLLSDVAGFTDDEDDDFNHPHGKPLPIEPASHFPGPYAWGPIDNERKDSSGSGSGTSGSSGSGSQRDPLSPVVGSGYPSQTNGSGVYPVHGIIGQQHSSSGSGSP